MTDFDKAATLTDRLRTMTTEYDFASQRVAQLTADISEVRADLAEALGFTSAPTKRQRAPRRPTGATSTAIITDAASKGPIRAEDMEHLYGGKRNSAAAQLAKLAKQGVLRRVGVGVYTISGVSVAAAQH